MMDFTIIQEVLRRLEAKHGAESPYVKFILWPDDSWAIERGDERLHDGVGGEEMSLLLADLRR